MAGAIATNRRRGGSRITNGDNRDQPMIGREIIRVNSVASTMDEIADLANAGVDEGAVVITEEQTAGRGRAGRSWQAPPRSSLLFSVLLRPDVPVERLATLSLVAGVAVAEAIERFGTSPSLKWPNDIWLDGRKVAGILVQSRVGPTGIAAILGIGINVNADPDVLPASATSIREALRRPVPREELFQAILLRLDSAYRSFCAQQGLPDLAGWTKRAALLGERVQVVDGATLHTGEMLGIDGGGALLLRATNEQVNRIVAGELTRGPRTAGTTD
jgi:BirA family biotin operon repressor/biotin-[acetyl-CoA-carboxylase] ligase